LVSHGASARETDPWTLIARDRLFEVQSLLATGKSAEALASAERQLESGDLSQPERMWLNIYRGCALDRAGQRASAAEAFRAAAAIHEHDDSRRGLRHALPTLKHLETIRRGVEGVTVRRGELKQGDKVFHWMALVPPGQARRAVIRVGHPSDAEGLAWTLISLRARAGVPRDAILVTTDLLSTLAHGRNLLVDDPGLLRDAPGAFTAIVDDVEQQLPIDRKQVYLTGFSFDGVWAWILGLDHPERYAGVVALSSCSYPAAISSRLERGKNLPICVMRGENDHQFPGRLEQEKKTAAEMIRWNPKSEWHLLPKTTHTEVWGQAAICFEAILGRQK
jgi:hypothetical protein